MPTRQKKKFCGLCPIKWTTTQNQRKVLQKNNVHCYCIVFLLILSNIFYFLTSNSNSNYTVYKFFRLVLKMKYGKHVVNNKDRGDESYEFCIQAFCICVLSFMVLVHFQSCLKINQPFNRNTVRKIERKNKRKIKRKKEREKETDEENKRENKRKTE